MKYKQQTTFYELGTVYIAHDIMCTSKTQSFCTNIFAKNDISSTFIIFFKNLCVFCRLFPLQNTLIFELHGVLPNLCFKKARTYKTQCMPVCKKSFAASCAIRRQVYSITAYTHISTNTLSYFCKMSVNPTACFSSERSQQRGRIVQHQIGLKCGIFDIIQTGLSGQQQTGIHPGRQTARNIGI